MIRVDGNPLLLLVHSIHPDLLQILQGGEYLKETEGGQCKARYAEQKPVCPGSEFA